MTTILADTDSLIKLTKAGLKEVVVNNFTVLIPPKVKEESIDHAHGKPDATIIERNIVRKKIKVHPTTRGEPEVEHEIRQLNIHAGEQDLYRLSSQTSYDLISSDDQKFLKILHLLNKKAVTPASLLVLLYKRKKIKPEEARTMLHHLKPYISMEEYELSLQEVD
mgnify:CR=1 FL=1